MKSPIGSYSKPLRPGVMLNVTNDGWFGLTPVLTSISPRRDCETIEQGMPLIRSANTGISAIVDP